MRSITVIKWILVWPTGVNSDQLKLQYIVEPHLGIDTEKAD